MTDLERLKELLETATPGPWEQALGDTRGERNHYTTEVTPSRHGGGWIVRVFAHDKLDHERAFGGMGAAAEYADQFHEAKGAGQMTYPTELTESELKGLGLTYACRNHVRYQDGAASKAPAVIFIDADFEVTDSYTKAFEDGKYVNEPAIIYVRLDQYRAALTAARPVLDREKVQETLERLIAEAESAHQDDPGATLSYYELADWLRSQIGEG